MKKFFEPIGTSLNNSKVRCALFGVCLILTMIFPLIFTDQYAVRLATLCLMYAGLSVSLNLVTGFLGQVSLGHAAFLGVGAYTSALLSQNFEWPFLTTALCALLVSALFGLLLGIPALKLSGSYLSIVTIGFCEIIRLIELNWVGLTRGPMGITGISRPTTFGIQIKSPASFYYLCLILLALICFVIFNLIRSHHGRAIQSIREDQIAAEAMGVNVYRYKLVSFSISAGMVGLLGAFYAHYMRFIDPSTFTFNQSIQILSMVILGGSGSIPGSFLGSIILSIVPELLRDLSELRMLIYGLALAVMIIFRPQGILGRKTLAQILKIERHYAREDGGQTVDLSKCKEEN